MKQIAWLVAGLGVIAALGATLGAGCQRGTEPAAPPSDLYRQDIARLCDVVAASGADQRTDNDRAYTIATWLAAHLETQEARDYLVRIAPITGEPKAEALETEARRVGLARCALAAEWR
jgi:hypothetical protein